MIALLMMVALGGPPQREVVKIGGMERSYWVQVPDNAKPEGKRSAVVVFHGAGPDHSDDKGAKFAKHTQMARAAAEYGAVAVFPNGVNGAWFPPQWAPEGVDDIAFAKALYDVLVRKYGVRDGRVAAVGFSSGGHMAMQWACNDPRLGGLVVLAAGLSEMQSRKCDLTAPLPTMLVYGREDPVNPYRGGKVTGARESQGREDAEVLSAERSGKFFADGNGCTKSAKHLPLIGPNGRTLGDIDRYRGCGKGRVDLISIPVGHVWPLGGTPNAARGASAYIAKFLKKRVWSKKLREP
ncbi:MAG: PHB depolymerase family esterase [Myxococcota bacterium]